MSKGKGAGLLRMEVRYRYASKPEIVPACKNCTHFGYDSSDYMGAKGISFSKVNRRCKQHKFSVSSNSVCDTHAFKYPDRSDA